MYCRILFTGGYFSLFSIFSLGRQVLVESAMCATGMEPDDSELLRRYVRDQDEGAFSLLVSGGTSIWCMRRP